MVDSAWSILFVTLRSDTEHVYIYVGLNETTRNNINTEITMSSSTSTTSSPSEKSSASQFAIPQSTFRRLVKGMIGSDHNVSADALEVLQHAGEQHVLETIDAAGSIAHYSNRETLYASDMALVRGLLDGKHRHRQAAPAPAPASN